MQRPLADSRPIGPLFKEETGILEVRRQCNPQLEMEIAETEAGGNDIFELVSDQARFDVDGVRVGLEEGEVRTREPSVTTVTIIAEEKSIPFADMEHLVQLFERKYTVFEADITASIEEDPEDVGIGDSIPMDFNPEPTER